MERKKWTPKAEITEAHLKFRKKEMAISAKKVCDGKNISAGYAFYFGLTIEQFRTWIEIQFTQELNWDNFGSVWQFEHIVPVSYFDFSNEEDLMLCWNFINIRVEMIEDHTNWNRIDVIAAGHYFEALYHKTGYSICKRMIDKIRKIELSSLNAEPSIESFILKNKEQLEIVLSFNKDEFNSLNAGVTIQNILLEREIIKKFG